MDFHFNTGRLYAREGQVIRAIWQPGNERILFADFSRCIRGAVAAPTHEVAFRLRGDLAAFVMRHYDRGAYEFNPDAMQIERDRDATVYEFRL